MDFDTIDTDIWQEIADMPAEIWDIPELYDDKCDFNEYLSSETDY